MKNNSLFTYVLWGLLALFLAIVGYYACQKQKEKKAKEEQDKAELEQTLRDMGYSQSDTAAAATGSTFAGGDTTRTTASTSRSTATKPSVNKNGIEDEPAGSVTGTKTTKPTTQAPTKPTTSATTTTAPKTTVAKTPATTAKSVKGPGSGRWAVRAGTFSYKDGARRRLEEVIKAGYPNAEIAQTSDGKAAVVVFRSNDKAAAIKVADKLEEKGIDAAVFDRKN